MLASQLYPSKLISRRDTRMSRNVKFSVPVGQAHHQPRPSSVNRARASSPIGAAKSKQFEDAPWRLQCRKSMPWHFGVDEPLTARSDLSRQRESRAPVIPLWRLAIGKCVAWRHHWRHVVLIIAKPAFETQPHQDTKSKQGRVAGMARKAICREARGGAICRGVD
jgi:hypothetical protein